jgi:hypothetical protein
MALFARREAIAAVCDERGDAALRLLELTVVGLSSQSLTCGKRPYSPEAWRKGLCAGAEEGRTRAIIKKLLAEREKKTGVRYICNNNKTQCLE